MHCVILTFRRVTHIVTYNKQFNPSMQTEMLLMQDFILVLAAVVESDQCCIKCSSN